MVSCNEFHKILEGKGVNFYSGVPDSLLKNFCAYITDNVEEQKHIIAANEGNAIGLATGSYLSTKQIPLVYMQNSGQGNATNPLVSLADPDVYSIPILLVIGWRGEPGKKDEPQHVKQGKITTKLLETLDVPYSILSEETTNLQEEIDKAFSYMKENSAPYALVIKKGTFEDYSLQNKVSTAFQLSREDAIKIITNSLDEKDIVVSTTGKTSRELFEYREELNQGHSKDFLTVGSMGHSSSIALGIALQKPKRSVYCFDGDGAFIMHMGALGITSSKEPKNFKHIVFNNGSHDSVGGQPTVGHQIDMTKIAEASGYKATFKAETKEELEEMVTLLKDVEGPALLEIQVNKGARKELGRPTTTPIENKEAFMNFLAE